MKQDVLEMYRRQFGPLAERMEEETIACSTAPVHFEGHPHEVPAILVKGDAETRLVRPEIRCQVLGIETSECPVIAVGVEFPYQRETLAGWYWSWLPMHTADQRRFIGSMSTAPVWLIVVFSGEAVSRALLVRTRDVARARYRMLWRVVESYQPNPKADVKRATEAAQAATAGALGKGFVLETVQDLEGSGGTAG